jgi:hypothetical protein
MEFTQEVQYELQRPNPRRGEHIMASIINASTSTGLVTTADTSGVLQLQTGGTTAVSIGTDQSFNFSVTGQRITGDFSNATITNRVAFQSSTTNGNTLVGAIPNGTSVVAGFWAYNNSDITNAGRFRVTTSTTEASLTTDYIGTGTYLPMTFNTGGSESLRLSATTKAVILAGGSTSANGTGITFPATQSASSDANTLDDYEEGTFTPTVVGSSTAGTATYSNQIGRYTKIGNRVLFNIRVTYTSGTGTGNLRVANLPFAVNASAANGAVSTYVINITLPASTYCVPTLDPSSSFIGMYVNAVGGGADNVVAYDTAGDIFLTGHYEV